MSEPYDTIERLVALCNERGDETSKLKATIAALREEMERLNSARIGLEVQQFTVRVEQYRRGLRRALEIVDQYGQTARDTIAMLIDKHGPVLDEAQKRPWMTREQAAWHIGDRIRGELGEDVL